MKKYEENKTRRLLKHILNLHKHCKDKPQNIVTQNQKPQRCQTKNHHNAKLKTTMMSQIIESTTM
jgi:hypothetical protein